MDSDAPLWQMPFTELALKALKPVSANTSVSSVRVMSKRTSGLSDP